MRSCRRNFLLRTINFIKLETPKMCMQKSKTANGAHRAHAKIVKFGQIVRKIQHLNPPRNRGRF